ncbi:hypothetical protein PRZ48_013815 [Zasmidium cellare]|uniref:Cobalamin-independent methionine synthase MetE C-terminal/archaeal domain-containing protein n=1 Tax=Zasmidium cellare TaxID=395010 RepID=A0ABR0E232_ZASCE|nr:hypothetical protein PRZ48_013815 [Zasmidium cellare]
MAIAKGCHLVGSVPLSDTEAVFRQCLAACPGRLKRIPDGETGQRQQFTTFQAQVFGAYPPMLTEFIHNAPINTREFTPEQIEEGIEKLKKAGIHTGYDDAALESYATFRKLRDQGVIPKGVRFQVCLPTVANVILPFVQRAFLPRVERIYEEALFRALRRIQDEIPHQDLAVQIDTAADTAFWEATNPETVKENSGLAWFQPWWEGDVKQYYTEYLQRFIAQVDQDVELGIHNCYGDMNHQHWHEPASLAVVVERAQWFMKSAAHKINFFHCPVPKSAEGHIDAYLAPLKDLVPLLEEHGTELYLGVIHEHKPELTKKYVEAAQKIVPEFGVATECGGGRMEWLDFEDTLRLCAEVSQPVIAVETERDVVPGAEVERITNGHVFGHGTAVTV